MKRFVVSAVVALLGCLVVATLFSTLPKRGIAGLAAPVVQADGGCSVASLSGPYATEGEGTIVGALPSFPPPPFAFGEVILDHFNGAGSFFGDAKVNLGGVVLDVPVTGTYTVNADCTGTVTVNTSLGLTLHNAMVVIGGGQRFILTETDPFAVIQRRGQRLGGD